MTQQGDDPARDDPAGDDPAGDDSAKRRSGKAIRQDTLMIALEVLLAGMPEISACWKSLPKMSACREVLLAGKVLLAENECLPVLKGLPV